MTDPVWMVSSSVLIVAVIALRAAFGSRMKPWLRCALWALVTLRLIVPGTVFSSPVSIEGAVERAQVVRDLEAVKQVSAIERTESGAIVGVIKPGPQAHSAPSAPHTPAASALDTGVILESSTPERFESIKRTMEAREVLRIVWLSGAAVCALWCLFVNLRFGLRLYRGRERYFTSLHCRVYSVKGLESPCCFMGSIYVPEDALGDRARLECILQHELAHRRHGDGVTAVLRNAALALHWYNPLAWAYAVLSRRDGELFADDGAIRALGEDERENYGRTLIELSRRRSRPGAAGGIAAIASTATTMTGGKRSIRERIAHIALPKKTGVLLTVLLLTLALFAAGCAFIGGESAKSREEAAAQSGIVFSAGNEFTAKEGYDTAELSFPEGNEYLPRSERIPLGAKFLLPEGWSVRAGLYEDRGYYPTEEMSGLCLAARLSFDESFSVYNEKGECVGTIGHSALYLSDEAKAELAGLGTSEERVQGKMKCCFAPIIIGMSKAELFYGDHAAVVPAGNELVISTIAFYEGTRKPDGTKDEYSFPLCAAFDDEYDYGFFIEFADGAVTDEQLYDIASSMRIGRKNSGAFPVSGNNKNKEIVFSAGNEFTAKEGYDTAELSFPEGNEYLPMSERIPLGAKFLLPEGWSVRAGLYEGVGYYPDKVISSICLAKRCDTDEAFSIYNEKGECVGTIGCAGVCLSAQDKEDWKFDSLSPEEQLRAKMMCCFAIMDGSMSSIQITDEEMARPVPAGTGRNVTTRSGYSGYAKPDGTKDRYTFPLAAAFDGEYDFGFFIEFADGAVTDEQLYDIASSMRIGRISE